MVDKEIIFVTGNEDKLKEYQMMLSAIKIRRQNIDLPELQGTPEEIVKEKAKLASQITGKTCFVDDTSLGFAEWGNLPGPYIKDFLQNVGAEKLAQTLLTSSDNHNAEAIASIGFCKKGQEAECVQGKVKGTIVLPRGTGGFAKGWDQIFVPKGEDKTFAEMSEEEKNSNSHRKKAIEAFEKFLEEKL